MNNSLAKRLIVIITFQIFTHSGVYAADSSSVRRQTIQSSYTSVTTHSQPILNEDYSVLPDCPYRISNCPHPLRGGGSSATCPDNCIATRRDSIQDNKIVATSSAICPAGYSMIGVYKMADEYTFDKNPAPIYPVTTLEKFNEYANSNRYQCGVRDKIYYTDWSKSMNQYYQGQVTTLPDYTLGSYAVVMISPYPDYMETGGQSNDWSSSCMFGGCTRYKYYQYQCKPGPGLFPTGNKAPSAIVCTRAINNYTPSSPLRPNRLDRT